MVVSRRLSTFFDVRRCVVGTFYLISLCRYIILRGLTVLFYGLNYVFWLFNEQAMIIVFCCRAYLVHSVY